ncbi:hypothetical protein EJ06DRAFT_481515 [Trichodelitschia bisporula]|uniref:ceramidase n=1 Tax=Trichodelitschia bisporula TaxID=703511 RepID=A0A6G1HPG0_9PEZI|nr:hypothetical protein EJ06DRAFT_481515 [Trichodelitschia bisporula]
MPPPTSTDPSPPVFKIDLSLPPEDRYTEVATAFAPELRGLASLFDELVLELGDRVPLSLIRGIARLLLRRLHSSEQTRELRGIDRVVGVGMWLLVAFNTLLDLLMGCTSGGARVRDEHGERMVHFRTLDWDMQALREVVVVLQFVRCADGPVVARSVTYAGFVGVLTGVRPDLSLSLNFRSTHANSNSVRSNLRYHGHQLAVLLGLRPSIATRLREILIATHETRPPTLEDLEINFPAMKTTACYIVASSGERTTVFEKDHVSAVQISSSTFVVATNHDAEHDDGGGDALLYRMPGMKEVIEESTERKACMTRRWERAVRGKEGGAVKAEKLLGYMERYPIASNMTHFAAVMDPARGEFMWIKCWLDPKVD